MVQELEREREFSAQIWEEYERKEKAVNEMEIRMQALQQCVAEMQQNSNSASDKNSMTRSLASIRRRRLRDLDELLRGAFRRIILDDESYEVLVDDFDRLDKAITILRDLDDKCSGYRSSGVAGAPAWWEISHVSTGRSDAGRIYWRQLPNATGNGISKELEVWVRTKRTQDKDIQRMRAAS